MASAPDTPAERAYVAARLTQLDDHFDRSREAMAAELDVYRDDLAADAAERNRIHQERCDAIAADRRAWIERWLSGDPDESAPTDVGRGQAEASPTGSSPASPPGPGPGQLHPDAEMAARIKSMSMQEYAQRRAEFGVRSPTDMSHLFGSNS